MSERLPVPASAASTSPKSAGRILPQIACVPMRRRLPDIFKDMIKRRWHRRGGAAARANMPVPGYLTPVHGKTSTVMPGVSSEYPELD